jgi:tripartite-type tricarboxylate transporter receptor subunit TctC
MSTNARGRRAAQGETIMSGFADRRGFLALAGGALAGTLPFSGMARAQAGWPNGPVRFIVPFAAGGTTDLFARLIGEHLQSRFGQGFVVENRAGAAGNTGVAALAQSAPDGQTIGMGTVSTHATNPSVYKGRMPYDHVRDFEPISLVALVPNMLVVNPDKVPARTLAEFITWAKGRNGQLSYGSSGVGTSTHLAAEFFSQLTGIRMSHVPRGK